MSKPMALKFTGKFREVKDDEGNVIQRRPVRWHEGVPARDLDERDIARLDAKRIKEITSPGPDGSPALYRDASPESEAKSPPPKETRKAADKPAESEKGKG